MDIARFLSLITTGRLWFANLETLAEADPHEAILPEAAFAHRSWHRPGDVPPDELVEVAKRGKAEGRTLKAQVEFEYRLREYFIFHAVAGRKEMFVSSWHASGRESAAMWRIYARDQYGLAITSSASRLRDALNAAQEKIYLGRVRYIDAKVDDVDPSNGFNVVLVKRSEYEYEQEVRLVHWRPDITNSLFQPLQAAQPISFDLDDKEKRRVLLEKIRALEFPSGVSIECNLSALIETVWISPYAPSWIDAAIERICEGLGLRLAVRRSSLLEVPSI